MLLTVAQLDPKATFGPHFEVYHSVHSHIIKHIFNS
jgi:hypothetical protein